MYLGKGGFAKRVFATSRLDGLEGEMISLGLAKVLARGRVVLAT